MCTHYQCAQVVKSNSDLRCYQTPSPPSTKKPRPPAASSERPGRGEVSNVESYNATSQLGSACRGHSQATSASASRTSSVSEHLRLLDLVQQRHQLLKRSLVLLRLIFRKQVRTHIEVIDNVCERQLDDLQLRRRATNHDLVDQASPPFCF